MKEEYWKQDFFSNLTGNRWIAISHIFKITPTCKSTFSKKNKEYLCWNLPMFPKLVQKQLFFYKKHLSATKAEKYFIFLQISSPANLSNINSLLRNALMIFFSSWHQLGSECFFFNECNIIHAQSLLNPANS